MPAIGDYDLTHIDKLNTIGIEILEEYKGAKAHILMKCKTCGFEYIATPLAKIQVNKKYPNSNGCDMCRRKREDVKYDSTRDNVLQILKEANLIILTPGYKGQRKNVYEKIRVKNTECGHEFNLCIGNFLYGGIKTTCTICGVKHRSDMLTRISNAKHLIWLETATEWQKFKHIVTMETERTYRKNLLSINPNGLWRGPAGTAGAHHVDHIISKRYCFDNDIPPELCAHIDNLRVIPWLENVKKGKHIVTDIPLIFDDYIESPSVVDWEISNTPEEQTIEEQISEYSDEDLFKEEFQ